MSRALLYLLVWVALSQGAAVGAESVVAPKPSPAASASPMSPTKLDPARDLKFEQVLDRTVPMDVELTGEDGKPMKLRDAMAGKPTVLALVYYGCPRICGLVLEGMIRSLKYIEGLDAGVDFQVVAVSFDPRETPSQAGKAKLGAIKLYDRAKAREGLRFLVGSEANVRKLADSIGFSYRWDEASKQFAHPTGIVVLTPAGRTARYFFGIDFPNKDLKLALVEASSGRIGSVVDQVLLFCYGFDDNTGRYTFLVMRLVRGAGILTLIVIGFALRSLRRRERARALEAA